MPRRSIVGKRRSSWELAPGALASSADLELGAGQGQEGAVRPVPVPIMVRVPRTSASRRSLLSAGPAGTSRPFHGLPRDRRGAKKPKHGTEVESLESSLERLQASAGVPFSLLLEADNGLASASVASSIAASTVATAI